MDVNAIAGRARRHYGQVSPWNMAQVRNYLREREGLGDPFLGRMEIEYKRFLGLVLATGLKKSVPISAQIDPMWHVHIMFTMDYTDMCHKVADGIYVHHLPAVTAEERGRLCDAYNHATLPLYRAAFGEPNPEFWPPNAQICVACCDRPEPSKDPATIRHLVI